MPLPSLYTLSQQYRELEFKLGTDEELDETALEAIRNTLDGLEGSIEVKAQNVGAYLLNLEAWAVATKEASKKLDARAKRIQRRADAMREYIRSAMVALDMKKIEGDELTLTRKLNPPSVMIDDEAEVPEAYLQPAHPLIAAVITGARSIGEGRSYLPSGAETGEFLVLLPQELEELLTLHLPAREPDKKKIAALLKAERDAHQAAIDLAKKAGAPAPAVPATMLSGCRLEQSERLDIKP